jgi:hypothetical protein
MVKLFDGYDASSMILGGVEIRGVKGLIKTAVLNNVPYNFSLQNQVRCSKNHRVTTAKGIVEWNV